MKKILLLAAALTLATSASAQRVYENKLTPLKDPAPLLADHPEFIEPVREVTRYEAPLLVNDDDADISVRAWRFSYNARGIIEMPNRLRGKDTAVIMVHPWGIDDGSGWQTPEPAGVCDFCTPWKNHFAAKHTHDVIRPFINDMRPHVGLVLYSLPGLRDPIRAKLYRCFTETPTAEQRAEGQKELDEKLKSFTYIGQPVLPEVKLTGDITVKDYFTQFPGLDPGDRYNNAGFWQLPIPVTRDIDVDPNDVVIYDKEGYDALRDFLKANHIRHVLLVGYATDMCYCKTTAGYDNLSKDFDVFLVGDATLATYPANDSPRFATNASISFASLQHLITQISWIKCDK